LTAFLQLAIILAILLLCAKAGGFLSTKLGQPSVLGELLVGVLLGPSLINIMHLPVFATHETGEFIKEFAELGVLLLMFLAGLELHLEDLARNKVPSALAGVFGVLVPVGLGYWVGIVLGYDNPHSIFLGLTLGATSVSISAQTLMELKVLRSRVGFGLLGAAVFDDILVILLLSIFLALQNGGNAIEIVLVVVKMIAFLGGSVAFGLWGLPWLTKKVSRIQISYGSLTLAIIIMLIFGIAAELVGGMAAITGTFLAGLMYSRTKQKSEIESGIKSIAYGLFVPIFFVNIGLTVNIRELDSSAILVTLAISLVAILGKIIGSGLGARAGKFTWLESLQLGIGMVSRGEVGLIVASVGLQSGLLSTELFANIIGLVLITTLITPPMLRAAFAYNKKPTPVVGTNA